MSQFTQQSARSFFDFTEATTAVLDLLETQLPDCAIFVAYHDEDAQLLRIVDFRGDDRFGISNGQTLPLLPGDAEREAHIDPAPAVLANPDVKGVASFVGIPLELQNGEHFGTLCAISAAAQRFHRTEIDLVTVLGRVIVNELERELAEQDLQQRHDDLVEHNQRLRVDVFTDALTGVSNRRGFERALAREWKLSQRGTVESYLVLIDLDGFKAINDTYGHAAGDDVLRICASALTEAARETDVVGRIGGDEFAAVLVGCQNAEEATLFRERAHHLLEELLEGSEAKVSFSAGHQALAEAPSPSRAMELADQAMYWQKRQRAGRLPRATDLASKIGGAPARSPVAGGAPIKRVPRGDKPTAETTAANTN